MKEPPPPGRPQDGDLAMTHIHPIISSLEDSGGWGWGGAVEAVARRRSIIPWAMPVPGSSLGTTSHQLTPVGTPLEDAVRQEMILSLPSVFKEGMRCLFSCNIQYIGHPQTWYLWHTPLYVGIHGTFTYANIWVSPLSVGVCNTHSTEWRIREHILQNIWSKKSFWEITHLFEGSPPCRLKIERHIVCA